MLLVFCSPLVLSPLVRSLHSSQLDDHGSVSGILWVYSVQCKLMQTEHVHQFRFHWLWPVLWAILMSLSFLPSKATLSFHLAILWRCFQLKKDEDEKMLAERGRFWPANDARRTLLVLTHQDIALKVPKVTHGATQWVTCWITLC